MVVQNLCHCDSLADLPAASEGREEELEHMASAVHQLLVGVGEDPAREGLVDTPRVSCCGGSREREPLGGAAACRRRLQTACCPTAAMPAARGQGLARHDPRLPPGVQEVG